MDLPALLLVILLLASSGVKQYTNDTSIHAASCHSHRQICAFGQHIQKIIDIYARQIRLYALISNATLADLNAAIELAPDNPELYTVRGQIYLNIYEWDKSLEDYNLAIELDPDYAEAYFQRGVLYYSILQTGQELREEALTDFRHYLELAPDGLYAEQAVDYVQTIETELAALNE